MSDEEFEIRKNELNSNRIFNDTDFVVDSDTYEIQSPLLKNPDVVCSSEQKEFFRNCFSEMGKGAAGVFYSPEINKHFGIRKLQFSQKKIVSLQNEISLLRFFRQHIDKFPFVAHMYGWSVYYDNCYIIVEHKDTDLKQLLQESSKNNDDITDVFLNIFKIIVAQLKVFSFFKIYHQDLHVGNVLIKEYDSPVHITWGGLNVYTKYVPFIHDFDFAGVRGKSTIKQIDNTFVNNNHWLNMFGFTNIIDKSIHYTKKCYDTYQLFNSMIHYTITENDEKSKFISIDLVRISRELFNEDINDNDFTSFIIMSVFNNSKSKIINKKDNVEYKMVLNVKMYRKNKELLYKTPILFYTQLNPFFEFFDILCEMYDVNNINIF
jgi:hypothetical protein